MFYSLFIFKTDSLTFDGYFPDVEGCLFAGRTLEETIENARIAFAQHASVLLEQGASIPVPKDPSDYLDDPALLEGMLISIDINPITYETKTIKFTLTMTGTLLKAIDNHIKDNPRYKNRSAFLSEIARQAIAKG